ncbi:MAG: uncharacterized protein JWN44_5372 [Myxococcales bacterium]|nr:uncharacterized protein [Myxococcales bacterium]
MRIAMTTSPKHSLVALVSLALGCAANTGSYERSCPPPVMTTTQAASRPSGRTRNVVIVTIDGVRWQEIFGGIDVARARNAGMSACDVVEGAELTPNLHRHFAGGGVVIGAPGYGEMIASGPNFVSLPGYEEIFTGRASSCTSNSCDHIAETTLVDELREELQLSVEQIAVITSWPTIERAAAADDHAITMSVGRHGGATRDLLRVTARASRILDDGGDADAYPGWLGYRADRYTAALALDYIVARRPRFMFIGLGDTDEYAHRRNYAGYVSALRAADEVVGELMDRLATLGEYGRETTVIVTTDHGRAANFASHGGDAPESRRVWLFAAGGAVPALGFADGSRVTRLADIAPTVRRWMGLHADSAGGAGSPVAELLPTELPGSLLASAPR